MSSGFTVDTSLLAAATRATMRFTARSFEDEFKSQMKGWVKEAIAVTPPRGGKFNSPKTAENRSAFKMRSDLRSKRRGIFTVLPDSLIDQAQANGQSPGSDHTRLWVTKDGRVYGTQRTHFRPNASTGEMRAHHKQYFRGGKMTRAGSYDRTERRWTWIDRMVVRESAYARYEKDAFRKIGFYAAGTLPAARKLGVPAPRYMGRNAGAPGSIRLRIGPDRMQMTIINAVNFTRLEGDVKRRWQWAANVQAKKMERRLPYLIRAAARRGNLG